MSGIAGVFINQAMPKQLSNYIENLGSSDQQGWRSDLLADAFERNSYLALQVNGVLASVIFYQELAEDLVEIYFLGTQTKFRGHGYMGQLLSEFVARQGSGAGVWLECREDNRVARRLYKRQGFARVGRRPNYYDDGSAAILFSF